MKADRKGGGRVKEDDSKKACASVYIVRSACKLRARRPEYKSVFFSYDINCWRKIGAYLA